MNSSWPELTFDDFFKGFVGKNVQRGRVKTIIGCDPAGPLFDESNPASRIAATDAEHVECIHTDSRNFGIGAAICAGLNIFLYNIMLEHTNDSLSCSGFFPKWRERTTWMFKYEIYGFWYNIWTFFFTI